MQVALQESAISNQKLAFQKGPVAQRLEQGTHNPLVASSNLAGPTKLGFIEASVQRLFLTTAHFHWETERQRVTPRCFFVSRGNSSNGHLVRLVEESG